MKPMNEGGRLAMIQQNHVQHRMNEDGDVLVVELEPSLFTRDKPRIRWTLELHERFLRAASELGGLFSATPKGILQKMNVRGVNVDQVKSHLQKVRIRNSSNKFIDKTASEEYLTGLLNAHMNQGRPATSDLESYVADINAYGRLLSHHEPPSPCESLRIGPDEEGSESIHKI
ncbi:hypothetical protein POM88_048975 [Heracleum sosnowskyi]|uniref:HTH myb-type domain-containing protein n=1 Tax=Heracleum sosnowskyi TaxID=360622 RepID=A0AAD8GW79_9APIA|nr:hypothetical protein POM88_048975 [Heracleum sosnowskyi]